MPLEPFVRSRPFWGPKRQASSRLQINFRLLGNMATAHILLGDREKEIELLRASLRANPDYNLARSNLHRLETLTPERVAVARTIEDHRRTGDPIVVWKKGRVVKIPANRIPRRKLA